MRSPLCAIACLLTIAAALARAGDTPALDDVLRRMDEKGKSVADFRARFKQEKQVYILDEPLRSEGEVLYRRPGRLRWETKKPEPSTLVIDDAGMRIHLPKLKQLEVFEFSGKDAMGAILPLFGQSTADLRRAYDVTLKSGDAGLFVLDLVPRNERVRRVLARIEVAVDRETLLPRRLVTQDPNGDLATTTFEEVEPNVGLGERDFELVVPPGTEVKKPLGGLPF